MPEGAEDPPEPDVVDDPAPDVVVAELVDLVDDPQLAATSATDAPSATIAPRRVAERFVRILFNVYSSLMVRGLRASQLAPRLNGPMVEYFAALRTSGRARHPGGVVARSSARSGRRRGDCGQGRLIRATFAFVAFMRSAGETSSSRPRFPALTYTVAQLREVSSTIVGSLRFWPIGLTPPTT